MTCCLGCVSVKIGGLMGVQARECVVIWMNERTDGRIIDIFIIFALPKIFCLFVLPV